MYCNVGATQGAECLRLQNCVAREHVGLEAFRPLSQSYACFSCYLQRGAKDLVLAGTALSFRHEATHGGQRCELLGYELSS